MSKQVLIRSSDRQAASATTSDSFQLNLRENLLNRYKICSVSFTNVVYNITTSNNTFYYSQASVNNTATLTPGYYDITSIGSALVAALTASSPTGTFTSSYSVVTGRFTLTNSSTAFIIRNTAGG